MTLSEQGKLGLSKWAFLGGLLTTEEELAGQPEYEAWKADTGKTGPDVFYAEKTAEHAHAKYAQGIAYSVYRAGDELSPFVHVGDFADEKSALKALVTESGEAYAWNQEGKTLAVRYESGYDAENSAEDGVGAIRVLERGLAPYRRADMDQTKLESALMEAEQQVTQAGSIINARKFLQEANNGLAKLYRPNETQSSKTGPIVWSDQNLAVQDIGNMSFVIHDAHKLNQALANTPIYSLTKEIKEAVTISYSDGKAAIKNILELAKNANNKQSSPHEDDKTRNENYWLNRELSGDDHEPDR